ncbi:hypothetical protein ACSNOI_20380 [Actinomadura kijaniata]|uniref:hypothetical protein n=1 Tax=Actinomadura kijaniata TaxID=46161 RepID=UPI003F19FABB
MLENKPSTVLTFKRMLDFCSAATPWTRRLWRLGSLLEIEELLEAAEANRAGALSDASVQYLSKALAKRVKRDCGLGSERDRGHLIGYINRPLPPESHDRQALLLLTEQARDKYLTNWARTVAADNVPVEVVARAVTSHLLDNGYSAVHINKWLTYHARYNPSVLSLGDLIEEGQTLVNRPTVVFQILVPLTACPPLPDHRDDCWLSSTEASEWLRYWFPGSQHPRVSGGLFLTIPARDVYSALAEVDEWTERISSRFRVGARKRLEFSPKAFVLGVPEAQEYVRSPRRVEVLSLEKTSEVFRLHLSPKIDSALELMGALDHGTRTTAVAGSWAALESLLVGPGDTSNRVIAATRIARIVSCSYIRAEFTSLANGYASEVDDDFSAELRGMAENRDKARAFAQAILSGRPVGINAPRYSAALQRMQGLLNNPADILPKIVGQLEDAFRRLYRQRNMIVHAGRTSSVALPGTLRTVASLVGAGMDRIVHENAAQGLDPLVVAAMAEINLERATHGSTERFMPLLD